MELSKMENLPENGNKRSISKSNEKHSNYFKRRVTVNNKEKICIIMKLISKTSAITNPGIYSSNFDVQNMARKNQSLN